MNRNSQKTNRSEYFKNYNQQIKEYLAHYYQTKKQAQKKLAEETRNKLSEAKAYKVLMSFKNYPELNKKNPVFALDQTFLEK